MLLLRQEVERLQRTGDGSLHSLLRRCALAVLNWGSETDSAKENAVTIPESFDTIVRHHFAVMSIVRIRSGDGKSKCTKITHFGCLRKEILIAIRYMIRVFFPTKENFISITRVSKWVKR